MRSSITFKPLRVTEEKLKTTIDKKNKIGPVTHSNVGQKH